MNVLKAKKSLTSRLVKALAALIDGAEQSKVKMGLPATQYDVVWFKDVGGRGEARSREGSSYSLQSFGSKYF